MKPIKSQFPFNTIDTKIFPLTALFRAGSEHLSRQIREIAKLGPLLKILRYSLKTFGTNQPQKYPFAGFGLFYLLPPLA